MSKILKIYVTPWRRCRRRLNARVRSCSFDGFLRGNKSLRRCKPKALGLIATSDTELMSVSALISSHKGDPATPCLFCMPFKGTDDQTQTPSNRICQIPKAAAPLFNDPRPSWNLEGQALPGRNGFIHSWASGRQRFHSASITTQA